MQHHPFLSPAIASTIAAAHGTPCYVYDQATLEAQADAMLGFPNAFGLTVRFAMKACPNASVLRLFAAKGLHLDASSGYEVRRAIKAGVSAERISLSSQELPGDFAELLRLVRPFMPDAEGRVRPTDVCLARTTRATAGIEP